jgi:hypothetical protein
VLEYHLGGKDISEVLAMSVSEAEEFFGAGEARTPAAHAVLDRLADVGLGYLSLGQPLTTLSGGERQRLKLATRMGEKGGVYVLDEPTSGLHLADVEQLLGPARPARRRGQVGDRDRASTRRSWRTPTGSSTSARVPATTAAGSSSRARPPTSSPARSTLTGEHLAAYVGG